MAVDFSNAVKTDEGVQVNGVVMQQIVEQCEGCERVKEFEGGTVNGFATVAGRNDDAIANFLTITI